MKITRKKQEKPFPKLMISGSGIIICATGIVDGTISGIRINSGKKSELWTIDSFKDYTPTPEPLPFPKFMIHKENGNVIYCRDSGSHCSIGHNGYGTVKLSDYEDFYGTIGNDI